jgi:hypothetical protein
VRTPALAAAPGRVPCAFFEPVLNDTQIPFRELVLPSRTQRAYPRPLDADDLLDSIEINIMSVISVQHWTGVFGIAFVALNAIVILLYFIYSGPPPVRNILTRVLVSIVALMGLIAFQVGFRYSILQVRYDLEWLGTLCLAFGLANTILTFVADSLQAGSVLGKTGSIDPTLVGFGAEKTMVIYGPVSRLLCAAFLVPAASAILITGILPAWIGWFALVVGVIQLAFVPTIFSTTDPAHFYSINGWGIPVAGGLYLLWILATSVFLILIY